MAFILYIVFYKYREKMHNKAIKGNKAGNESEWIQNQKALTQ